MELRALLPLRRKSCCRFLSPLKVLRPRPGLNPRTLCPMASTITSRLPRPTSSPCSQNPNIWEVQFWPRFSTLRILYKIHNKITELVCPVSAWVLALHFQNYERISVTVKRGTSLILKITAFWDIAPCNSFKYTYVSEVCTPLPSSSGRCIS
jgi:hypothetical protein